MNSIFEIYNASAGSGKTFTLTSRYLVKFLGSSQNESFKRILALTFTNKASEEMKNRILSSLKEFSNRKNGEDPSFMLKEVQRQLGISYDDIVVRSKKRLTLLLHNYSFFNVSTLDSFSHNIIRSFSKDVIRPSRRLKPSSIRRCERSWFVFSLNSSPSSSFPLYTARAHVGLVYNEECWTG